MNCRQFRESYSEFADGLLDELDEVEARRHLAECPCCRRFDAAYETGRGALLALPSLAPSRGFARRLRQRLRREGAAPALRQWSGATGGLLVLAVVGVVALELRDRPDAGGPERSDAIPLPPPVVPPPPAVRLAFDTSIEQFGDPFHPIPAGSDTAISATLTERFVDYAVLTSR